MPRRKVTTTAVVDAAIRLADAEGYERLTLVRLAEELRIGPSSLFNHIAGLAELRCQLQLRGLQELTMRAGRAAVGRAGADAVMACAIATREFAREHPGLYSATLPAVPETPSENSLLAAELNAAAEQFVGIFFDALRQYGFEGEEAVHAVRGLFSVVHGFTMLERAGTFGMPVSQDESFRWLVQHYLTSLTTGDRARDKGRK